MWRPLYQTDGTVVLKCFQFRPSLVAVCFVGLFTGRSVRYNNVAACVTEINGYVSTTQVNGYRQKAKTVTCYSKARFKHRISHVPNLLQVSNAQEVQRLTKIKFDNSTSVASSTEPVKSRQKFNCCLLCRIEFVNRV